MSRLGLVAACAVLAGGALALVLYREERGAEREPRGEPPAAPGSRSGALLALPATPGSVADEAGPGAAAKPRATRVAADAWLPRGEIHGRLVRAESGAPFLEQKLVLLAAPGNSVAETVRTGEGGRFTSLRRFPRGPVRAWVREPETGERIVRHEAEFDPEDPHEWLVPVPTPSETAAAAVAVDGVTLHGLVVDLGAHAVEGAQVQLFSRPEEPGAPAVSSTDAAGEFLLEDLAPGPHRLLVRGRFVASEPLELVLGDGRNDAGRILLPAAAPAGALRGRFVADGGGDPFAALLVRELDTGRELAVTSDWNFFSREDDGVTHFEVPGLSAGEYELTVVALDGREYEPPSLRASPPADELEFRARPVPPRFFGLCVREAGSGADLERVVLLGRIHGQWFGGEGAEPRLPAGFDLWVAYAEGHRPARGDFASARRVARADAGDGELYEVEVALEPGYGLAVLFKDAESPRLLAPEFDDLIGPAVEGVVVLADGQPVGRSDADGLAVLDLSRAPARLAFALPGWRVVHERDSDGLRVVQMARE